MIRKIARITAVAALVAAPSLVSAQTTCQNQNSCSLGATASMTIPTLVRLQIPSNAVAIDASSLTDLSAATSVTTAFNGVDVRANAAWTLSIGAAAANWTYVGTEAGVRARNTLEVSTDAGTTYNAMTASAAAATGARTNGTNVDFLFRTQFPAGYDDPANRPGAYTLALTFTLSAP